MNPTEKQIDEIAEDIECGMKCYFNLKTGEIVTIRDFDSCPLADEDQWKDEIKKIEKNSDDYFEFEGFESHKSFRIMADFASDVDDEKLQNNLIDALNRPKPFQKFK